MIVRTSIAGRQAPSRRGEAATEVTITDDGAPWDGLREECGVIGVSLPGRAAAPYLHLGLLALQHRGQESAGIATHKGGRLAVHKDMGLVAQVFSDANVKSLTGSVGIGHVRYATMGSAVLANAQPMVASSPWGPIAIAHNGNLTNAGALRTALEAQGETFTATSDTEVLLRCIARSRAPSLAAAIAETMGRIEGAYTVVLLAGARVYAFRDAHAIRPLVLGRLQDGWVVASETCAFDNIGAEFARDVAPGEIVSLEGASHASMRAIPRARVAQCVFEYIYFARPDTTLAGVNVHQARRRMGRVLAAEHPVAADIVVPVPDSGTSAALGFAEATGVPFEFGIVKNRYIGRTFMQPDQGTRDFGVRVKLNPVREIVEGRRIALVDDSIVRGTTAGKIVAMLRHCGALEVHLRISSPPIRWPCFYGVDTSNRRELVAAHLEVDEIRRQIGADSLGYLSQDGLVSAIRLPRDKLCMACLDGDYPTTTGAEEDAGKYALERRP